MDWVPGGYFFLLAAIKRPIMPTTKMPVWMRSEYVTIGQPPFHKIRGQEAAPCPGANRLPLLAVPDITIAYLSKKRNKNRPFDREGHQ